MPGQSPVANHQSPSSVERLTTRDSRLTTREGRVVIERLRPEIDGGRFPIKRTVGERVVVTADIFADGHDVLAAVVRDRQASAGREERHDEWRETPMTLVVPGLDEWQGAFDVGAIGWHEYEIVAWVDAFLTWRRELQIKASAGQDVSLELLEGSLIIRDAAEKVRLQADTTYSQNVVSSPQNVVSGFSRTSEDIDRLLESADALTDRTPIADRVVVALDARLLELMSRHADRSRATVSARRRVWVDRERARFGAWYEMFPRSAGADPHRSGTFQEAAADLPRIADLGFDVLYLPPIHPIGRSFRKGPNNTLAAGPDDPGSPWAIGAAEGGHTEIEPGLGTVTDFEAFRAAAERLGLEIALDLAWQSSPDHPWVREHPEWFRRRPDGTIKYAENPPKKYQDIYPFDFENEDWRGLWQALLDVTRTWIERGVRIFRVDNPHTKPFGFWEWLIDRVHADYPDVLFLSEAFTRPKPLRYLAKAGFTQSYTYFTWRNTKAEIVDFAGKLAETADYLRPNLFANTPDILHQYLQLGGRPAFETRLLLAATLAASYGIYSGFELCENRPLRPGSEEYADSEKYQYRKRDWSQAGRISELICRINRARRSTPALQFDRPLRFHDTDNPNIIAYSKTAPDGSGPVFVVINLDPHHMQHGFVETPFDADAFVVRDLLDDVDYTWHRGWNYVRFDPEVRQGHVLTLTWPSKLPV